MHRFESSFEESDSTLFPRLMFRFVKSDVFRSIDKSTVHSFVYRSRYINLLLCNLFLLFADESLTFEALVDERDASTSFAGQHVHNVKFPCPNCSSVFNRKNNLQKHLKYECGQLPRFKCPHCEYLSKKTSNVRAHIRSIHFGSIIYVIDLKSSCV